MHIVVSKIQLVNEKKATIYNKIKKTRHTSRPEEKIDNGSFQCML